jgi:hypothetical protein
MPTPLVDTPLSELNKPKDFQSHQGKGKAPMASSSHSLHDKKNHACLYAHVKNASSVVHHNSCYDHVVLPTRHDADFESYAMYE